MDELIGREAELAWLHDRLRDAASGRGRLVLLGGDAGIGKTRLAEEIARDAEAMAMPVAWGRGIETEGAPAFWPWRQVVRDLATQRDPSDIREAAGPDAPALSQFSPELRRLLGFAGSALPDAPEGRFQVFDAVTGLLCRTAASGGLLVVLDDAHWADRPSILLLRHLAGELPRARILVLATHRNAEGSDADLLGALAAGRGAELLHLGGLDRSACAQQLQAVAGTVVDEATADRVHAITEGNPLFTAEMGRLLLDLGVAATTVATRLEVPQTVREVMRRRVAQLNEECRTLLDAASVVGREFDAEVLALMTDQSVVAVLDKLEAALRARVLETGASARQLRFVHVLLRETLYVELASSLRHHLHRRAADALEWLQAQHLDAHLTAIAQHRLAAATTGDETLVAAHWVRRAADQAMEHLAWEEGVRLNRVALEVAGDRFGPGSRAEAQLALATGLCDSGELSESLQQCVEASRSARAARRPELMGAAALVLEGITEPHWNATLVALCDDALAALPEESRGLRARVLAQRTTWRVMAGDRAGAEEASAAAVALAELSGDDAAVASTLRARQVVLSGPEGVEERLRIATRMLDLGTRTGDAKAVLWGRLWRIETEIETGGVEAARRDIDALAVQVSARSNPVAQWHLRRLQSMMAQARGEFDAALALAAEARDIMSRANHVQAVGMYDAFLSGAMAHHRGVGEGRVEAIRRYVVMLHGPFGPLVRVSFANLLLWSGRIDEARREWRLLPPGDTHFMPGTGRLAYDAFRAQLAAQVGDCAEATSLYAALLPFRDRHLGAGGPEYRGSMELVLGAIARHCGEARVAVEHLRRALDEHRRAEFPPFVAETQCELAETLLGVDAATHRREARALATEALDTARRLGMVPFVERAERILRSSPRREASPLSRREEEVAALVAKGLTSKEIAAMLHLSERTAQNHVQHILDKLGFASRSRIAAWVADRAASAER